MAKKARRKSAAKVKKSKTKKTKAKRTKGKAKAATKKRKGRKAKPRGFGAKVSSAYRTVVDTVKGTDQLRNKMEQPGTSESE